MGSGFQRECQWNVDICVDCTGTLWSIRGCLGGIHWDCGHYSECVQTLLTNRWLYEGYFVNHGTVLGHCVWFVTTQRELWNCIDSIGVMGMCT